MRIKKITSRNRRDFTALIECEHYGAQSSTQGYDNRHYHEVVVPSIVCGECGKNAPDD